MVWRQGPNSLPTRFIFAELMRVQDPSTSCVNLQDATCQLTHTCGRTSRGSHFNAGSFVGGMFVMLGAIVLLAGAYFLYTNWASRRNAYQQVN